MAARANLEVRIVGHRVDIGLDRPERLNALSRQLLIDLDSALDEIEESDARVVVVHGTGDRAFCAGADIDELSGPDEDPGRWLERGQRVLRRIETLDRPTLAVVDGLALGGGFELAMACRLVISSTRGRFGLPEPKLGLIPGLGGVQRLMRQVGTHRANRILLTGEIIGAAEAHELGLLSFPPIPPADLADFASDLCETIAALSPRATTAILAAQAFGTASTLEQALANDLSLAAAAIASPDGREGMTAFLEKRPASFPSPHAALGTPPPERAR